MRVDGLCSASFGCCQPMRVDGLCSAGFGYCKPMRVDEFFVQPAWAGVTLCMLTDLCSEHDAHIHAIHSEGTMWQ